MESGRAALSPAPVFPLNREAIDGYLQRKSSQGAAPVTIGKYRTPLLHLLQWSGEPAELTPPKLQLWRQALVEHGYSKISVQKYVTVVNDFLRSAGQEALCIPKPARYDLTGRRFGYLTVVAQTSRRQHKYIVWKCVCKCGREVEIPSGMLLEGNTTSCGCLNTEILQHHNRYQEGTELLRSMTERVLSPHAASGYVGVMLRQDRWVAYINYKGVRHHLGTYTKLEDAVKARARAKEAVMEDAARIYGETDHLYGPPPRRPPRPVLEPVPEPALPRARRSNNTSGCPGVTLQRGKWSASISVHGRRYRMGVYARLEDAVAARKRAEALAQAGDMEGLEAICGK